MKKESDYKPIDCGLYDELELLALRGTSVDLTYRTENGIEKTRARLTNLIVRDDAEWVIIDSTNSIRLDRIISLNNIPFQ